MQTGAIFPLQLFTFPKSPFLIFGHPDYWRWSRTHTNKERIEPTSSKSCRTRRMKYTMTIIATQCARFVLFSRHYYYSPPPSDEHWPLLCPVENSASEENCKDFVVQCIHRRASRALTMLDGVILTCRCTGAPAHCAVAVQLTCWSTVQTAGAQLTRSWLSRSFFITIWSTGLQKLWLVASNQEIVSHARHTRQNITIKIVLWKYITRHQFLTAKWPRRTEYFASRLLLWFL